MRDYIHRRATPPKRVTSPTWSPPPSYKQALSYYVCSLRWLLYFNFLREQLSNVFSRPVFSYTKSLLFPRYYNYHMQTLGGVFWFPDQSTQSKRPKLIKQQGLLLEL